MIYGYVRVSSKSQLDNNSLEHQEQEILKEYPNAIIVKEQFTAKSIHRPKFQWLLGRLKANDKLVVCKLDRFCRSTKEGLECIEDLKNRGVKVHILNMGLIEDTPMGNLIVTNLLAFAEFERAMIVERTQGGKAIARQRNDYREGRPTVHKRKAIQHALELLESHSYKEVVEITGISKSTLVRAKNKLKMNSSEFSTEKTN